MISPIHHILERFPFERSWHLKKPGLAFIPEVDLKETKDSFLVCCELAGIPEENISVEFKEGRLVISGRKDEKKQEKGMSC